MSTCFFCCYKAFFVCILLCRCIRLKENYYGFGFSKTKKKKYLVAQVYIPDNYSLVVLADRNIAISLKPYVNYFKHPLFDS